METTWENRLLLAKLALALIGISMTTCIISLGSAVKLSISVLSYGTVLSEKSIHAFTFIAILLNVCIFVINGRGVCPHWNIIDDDDKSAEEDMNDNENHPMEDAKLDHDGEMKQKALRSLGRWQISGTAAILMDVCIAGAAFSLWHSTSVATNFQAGLKRSISKFAHDVDTKMEMHKLQINFHCCGSSSFTDWFETNWKNGTGENSKTSEDVPWSCCDPNVFRPCIHDKIKHKTSSYDPEKDLTIFQPGCASIIAGELHTILLVLAIFHVVNACIQLPTTLCSRICTTGILDAIERGDAEGMGQAWIFKETKELNHAEEGTNINSGPTRNSTKYFSRQQSLRGYRYRRL